MTTRNNVQRAAAALGARAKQRHPDGPHAKAFREAVRKLSERAGAAGSSLTAACRIAGVARATPDRWRARPPKSVELLDSLERAVSEIESQARNREPD